MSISSRGSSAPQAWLALLLLVSPAVLVSASSHQGAPVVLEIPGDDGDAWAVAIRSQDEPSSYQGNELIVSIQLRGEHLQSAASMGIIELDKQADGSFEHGGGMVGSSFQGEDRIALTHVGDVSPDEERPALSLEPLIQTDGTIGAGGEIRSMEPGEWRYFVIWAAGSEESLFRLRGDGFEVRSLIEGEAVSLGNSELLGDGSTYVQQGIELPAPALKEDATIGTGIAVGTDQGALIETEEPLLGMFATFHLRDLCVAGCYRVGNAIEAGASAVVDGGLVNTSIVTPDAGHDWHDHGSYWLMAKPEADNWYKATTPGTYEFRVDHLTDASGPTYREPLAGTGAKLNGEQMVVSVGSVDYTKLAEA